MKLFFFFPCLYFQRIVVITKLDTVPHIQNKKSYKTIPAVLFNMSQFMPQPSLVLKERFFGCIMEMYGFTKYNGHLPGL